MTKETDVSTRDTTHTISEADAQQVLHAMSVSILSAPRREDVIALNKAIVVMQDVLGLSLPEGDREAARTGEGVIRPEVIPASGSSDSDEQS